MREPTRKEVERRLARLGREVAVAASERGVSGVRMVRRKPALKPSRGGEGARLARRAMREIREYLKGERTAFRLPADLSPITPFTRAVLRETAKIPYGETRSYGWVAARVGQPRAARAVGQALGRNPVPLLIP